MERDGLSVCVVENGENATNEGETEAAIVHKTENLHRQICHAESLKADNASAKEDKTGQDVQHDQDLPLRADEAWNSTSSMSDTNFSIFGPTFVKIPLEETDVDEDVLYGEMNSKTLDLSLLISLLPVNFQNSVYEKLMPSSST